MLLLTPSCGYVAPHLCVVSNKALIGGRLGMYLPGNHTIYLAPGADEQVLNHELAHAKGSSLGEREWYEVWW